MGRHVPRLYYGIAAIPRAHNVTSGCGPLLKGYPFGTSACTILGLLGGQCLPGHSRKTPWHAEEFGV